MIKYTYQDNWDAALSDLSMISAHNASSIIEKIMSTYDEDDCIYGLFSALSKTLQTVSPFIATHNYCLRIESCSGAGEIEINISPIYHLGPEYPNEYQQKNGKELDHEAIVGLIELPAGDLTEEAHRKFSLGIDAGIVFKGSRISHNKTLILMLKPINTGLMATLSCNSQTTSKMFTWASLGINPEVNMKPVPIEAKA